MRKEGSSTSCCNKASATDGTVLISVVPVSRDGLSISDMTEETGRTQPPTTRGANISKIERSNVVGVAASVCARYSGPQS
ncbi:hypothetical protein D3C81_1890090 [compost metagenome]